MASIESQALPWFEANADLEAALQRKAMPCWVWARDHARRPDLFFRFEDLFAALAIRLDRLDDAIRLFETIAARPVDERERAAHEKDEARRLGRLARSKRPHLIVEPIAHWHQGALTRLEALRAFARTQRAEI